MTNTAWIGYGTAPPPLGADHCTRASSVGNRPPTAVRVPCGPCGQGAKLHRHPAVSTRPPALSTHETGSPALQRARFHHRGIRNPWPRLVSVNPHPAPPAPLQRACFLAVLPLRSSQPVARAAYQGARSPPSPSSMSKNIRPGSTWAESFRAPANTPHYPGDLD
ncbi:hypothetical protein G7Z17_g7293 [Cylindrodendrum hubeiense]|uniref:Uncharacterized protein n=1 Tax=Cylindrodendrum hubeiense TaxID=595255 RepID=A0A9P5H7E1_9HYPO|nr:hypothetical protein G7Z17_g7293 [Cylindrodendrum hubeiense]